MLTEKEYYNTWAEYSALTQKKEHDGYLFTEEERLAEVKKKLDRFAHVLCFRMVNKHRENCRTGVKRDERLIKKVEKLQCLAKKFDAGIPICEEDYMDTYSIDPLYIRGGIYAGIVVIILISKFLGWL